MGQLGNLTNSIGRLKKSSRQEELAAMLGVETSSLDAPEPMDSDDLRVGQVTAALTQVSTELKTIAGSVEKRSDDIEKKMDKRNLALTKRLETYFKANGNAIQIAVSKVAERAETDLRSTILALSEIKDDGSLVQQLIDALGEVTKVEQSTVRFDIERDNNGYIESVTAVPI